MIRNYLQLTLKKWSLLWFSNKYLSKECNFFLLYFFACGLFFSHCRKRSGLNIQKSAGAALWPRIDSKINENANEWKPLQFDFTFRKSESAEMENEWDLDQEFLSEDVKANLPFCIDSLSENMENKLFNSKDKIFTEYDKEYTKVS